MRGEAVAPELIEGGLTGELAGLSMAADVRLITSALADGQGGGKGETEMAVTDAAWAWYTLSGWKEGVVKMFYCSQYRAAGGGAKLPTIFPLCVPMICAYISIEYAHRKCW